MCEWYEKATLEMAEDAVRGGRVTYSGPRDQLGFPCGGNYHQSGVCPGCGKKLKVIAGEYVTQVHHADYPVGQYKSYSNLPS